MRNVAPFWKRSAPPGKDPKHQGDLWLNGKAEKAVELARERLAKQK